MLPIYLAILSISIVVLSKSSHVVINSSIKLARITKLGEMVIGFLVLSVATSIPELAVAFSAVMTQDVGITIGDILGANVANITLIIGIMAILNPIRITGVALKKLSTILFLSSLIPLLLLNVAYVRAVGMILVATFFIFTLYSIKKRIMFEIARIRPATLLRRLAIPFEYYRTLFVLCLALFGVIFSSRFVVDSASAIASILGITKSVIGATIIAIGTTLPELATSLTGMKRGRTSLALGTTIGSCLVNLTLILGIVLATSAFLVDMEIFSTLSLFVALVTIIAWCFLTTGRILDRTEGIALLFVYIMFIITTFSLQITLL